MINSLILSIEKCPLSGRCVATIGDYRDSFRVPVMNILKMDCSNQILECELIPFLNDVVKVANKFKKYQKEEFIKELLGVVAQLNKSLDTEGLL